MGKDKKNNDTALKSVKKNRPKRESLDDSDHNPEPPMVPTTTEAPPPTYFSEAPPEGPTFKKLKAHQSFFDGLKELDPSLLSNFKGKHGIMSRRVVLPGHIGMGSKYGRTKFFPPGNYLWTGIGGKWDGAVELQKEGEDVRITHGEVTILSLTENQNIVVQIDKTQYLVGSGLYIVRQPARVEGEPIDLQKLKNKHTANVITESSEKKVDKNGKVVYKDKQNTKKITSGWTEQQGAINFIRPEPGFRYVIQTPTGFRLGDEFTIARGQEKFLSFMNFLQQSRTTRTFSFLSKDFQDVNVKIQLTWQMLDGVRWLKNGRGYDDPFDLLEEKAEAAFRDQICAMTHIEALAQKSDGFEDMEASVFPKLVKDAHRIGANLIGMEVRELSYPLIENRERVLAEKESKAKEKIRQREVDIETQRLEDQKQAQLEKAEQERKLQANKADSEALAIKDQRDLAKVEAKNAQKQAEVDGDALREKARLEAELKQEEIKARTAQTIAEGEAEARRAAAKGEADAILSVARAKNAAMLEEAEAKAQAAKKMADALSANEQLVELEKAKLMAQVQIEVAKSSAAFANNPDAILSADLARDYARTRLGFSPQEYMPVPMIGGGLKKESRR